MEEKGLRMEDGKWKMENGRWKMEYGKWNMENGRWKKILIWLKIYCSLQPKVVKKVKFG